jgi:hypothetical protein
MEKDEKGRGFSVEMKGMNQISSLSLNEMSRERILIEGNIGTLNDFGWNDDSVLVVLGEKGNIHIDLTKVEVMRKLEQS